LDIKREPPKKTKQYILWSVALLGIVAVSVAISSLKPAAPTVERGTLWFGVAQRGEMTREVNAPGTLVPERVRIIVALAGGRIEALPVRPGETVSPSTLLVELSNPDVTLNLLQFQQQLSQAVGNLATLKNTLRQQMLGQEGQITQLRTSFAAAVRDAAVNDSLFKRTPPLVTANEVARTRDAVADLKIRVDLEVQRAKDMKEAEAQQIALAEQQIQGLRRIIQEQQNKVSSLRVYAPEGGQLQTLGNPQLELGQYVNSGVEIARVVQPGKLKAVLRVPETQAKDVVVGQKAKIDLHNNNVVNGHVIRKDPSSQGGSITVEVAIDGDLPPGTSSDLAVDGTIEIERLPNVMFIPRPGFGQADNSVGIFKVNPNQGEANRVTIQLGAASVNTIVVKGGLNVGDSVIISDMSAYDQTNRVRIK
jgi:multidrug resistance efflux pump